MGKCSRWKPSSAGRASWRGPTAKPHSKPPWRRFSWFKGGGLSIVRSAAGSWMRSMTNTNFSGKAGRGGWSREALTPSGGLPNGDSKEKVPVKKNSARRLRSSGMKRCCNIRLPFKRKRQQSFATSCSYRREVASVLLRNRSFSQHDCRCPNAVDTCRIFLFQYSSLIRGENVV